ncbi:MAG TPA: epoxide hydrolase N-terminal domain-containing protein [Trebonia sp.]|jgi:signal transduction histidine kinase|nr:epoxide hydrolase N-terminal domain-containing protein [Trebonia sp.]
MAAEPFEVSITEAEIADLRERLRRTRWPEPEPVDDWSQGLPLAYAQELCRSWTEDNDFGFAERLNVFPQYRDTVDGLGIHFLHVRSPEPDAFPLVLTHGWPGSVIYAGSTLEPPLPPDTEARLVSFTELVATAIANAQSRAELVASRARIVAAADEARRRIQRDLHDGTQQQLVSLMLDLRQVQAAAPPELEEGLARIAERATDVFNQVREISHGIHPAILSESGLTPALKALARRSAVPVELDLRTGRRLPDQVEVAAYYAVSEALANAAKHARASVVHVELDTPDAVVRLAIRDDGIGGADPARGSGLTGLRDRIEAAGGTFDVTSPADGGTTLLIEIPV